MKAPQRAGLLLACAALAGCGAGDKAAETLPSRPISVERGRLLLAQYQCGSCHAIPGVASSRAQVASSLSAYGLRSYIAGRFPNQPALLAQWIVQPQAMAPGTLMPAMGVQPAEAADMAAYLLSQK
jgi:cytochrome c2